jgi:3-methyl-2-oxobutanoate hydroxymethyltransferase
VAEMVDADTAAEISRRLRIPLIGIGSGASCDGQILVAHDILGLTPGKIPSFARSYASLGTATKEAFRQYVDDVHQKRFPS